jgi:hypothetical protein
MQIKKPRWCVSWFNDPYFNSVKFTSLFWALVTAWRCWRNGYTKITVKRCKGKPMEELIRNAERSAERSMKNAD